MPDSYYTKFKSLQTALYAGPFFAALSFAAYLFAAIYVDDDRKKVDDYIKSKFKIKLIEKKIKLIFCKKKKECQKSNERQNSSSQSDSNLNEIISDETKDGQNAYLNQISSSEVNLSLQPSVQIKPEINNIDINNEMPVMFNSSAHLISKSNQSNIDK